MYVGWRARSSRIAKNGVKKSFSHIILGCSKDFSDKFRKIVYSLAEPLDSARPGLVIQYDGDDSLGVIRAPHGNVKHHDRPFVRSLPSTIKGMRDRLKKGIRPQLAYEESKQSAEALVAQENVDLHVMEPIIGPRNLKCAQNIKYGVRQSKEIITR